jgi:DNA-binding CsgD family transcriptional regulator
MVRPPTAIAVNDPLVRRLRDLWVGGMSLARVAAAVGLSVADTEQRLVSLGFDPRPPRRADAETNLRKLIEEGLSPADVATRLGMTERSVRSWMARAGIPQPPKPKQSAAVSEKVAGLYEQGLSIRAVAAELGLHQRQVWRHLKRAGVARRPRNSAGIVLSRPELERLYVRGGWSVAEVARLFEVQPEAVVRNLDRYGIPRRRDVPIDRAILKQLYVGDRLGIRPTAARLGVSQSKVRRDLAHHDLPIRRPGRPASQQPGG